MRNTNRRILLLLYYYYKTALDSQSLAMFKFRLKTRLFDLAHNS